MLELPFSLVRSLSGPLTIQTGTLQVGSPNTLSLIGNVPNTGTAPGVIIDNATALTATLRPLLSLRTGGIERAAVYFNGTSSVAAADQFFSYGSQTFQMSSGALDGAAATAFVLTTQTNLVNATAKIASIQNANIEKRAWDKNGKTVLPTGGAAAVIGVSAAMTAGSVTVNTTAVTASSIIFICHGGATAVTNWGSLGATARVAGTSFTVSSSNSADTDTVNWSIVN